MRSSLYRLLTLSSLLFAASCATAVDNPNVKLNSQPQIGYEITFKTKDALGSFDRIEGEMNYAVDNKYCSPEDRISGAYPKRPIKAVPFNFNVINGSAFTGIIYLDQLQDEDYFGLGVCHWKLNMVNVKMYNGDIEFRTSISPEEIQTQKTNTRYFSKIHFNKPNYKGKGPSYATLAHSGLPLDAPTAVRVRENLSEYYQVSLIPKKKFK